MMEIFVSIRFEAALRLPEAPAGSKAGRLHGHSFEAEIWVAGDVGDQTGWVMDFAELRRLVAPVVEALDHQYLNDIPGLENPTAPAIAGWIFDRLRSDVPGLVRVALRDPEGGAVARRLD
jgi:6-pyruvoyltetrahydropterin/6-carboxytetrahydropterin synthase